MKTWKTLPVILGTTLITLGSSPAKANTIIPVLEPLPFPEENVLRFGIIGEFDDGGTIAQGSFFDLFDSGDGMYELINWEITTTPGTTLDGTNYIGDILSLEFIDELNFGSAEFIDGEGSGYLALSEQVSFENSDSFDSLFVGFDFNPDEITFGETSEDSFTFDFVEEIEEGGFREGVVSIIPEGLTETFPILPDFQEDGVFEFFDGLSGRWFDPIPADGFTYEMLGDSLFTGIIGFPEGIGDADGFFTVSVGDTILGDFAVGDTVDFIDLLGDGVSSFTISGIDPTVDADNPDAFPLQLTFDTDMADFRMTADVVPEPLTILGAGTALGFGGFFKRQLGKKKSNKKNVR